MPYVSVLLLCGFGIVFGSELVTFCKPPNPKTILDSKGLIESVKLGGGGRGINLVYNHVYKKKNQKKQTTFRFEWLL